MTAVVWFRNDLRVTDNPALYEACSRHNQVIAVFCITPGQWLQHDLGDNKIGFIEASVLDLQTALAKLGISLCFLRHDTFRETPQALQAFCSKVKAVALYFNHEYEVNERSRDALVTTALTHEGMHVVTFHDQVILPPGAIALP